MRRATICRVGAELTGPGTLFLVGTPIGNLGDMTDRARATLGVVDLVAAEDTRRTGSLLKRFGIAASRMVSLHDVNERERTEEVLRELEAGRDVALVSDAGMPGVSDPGFRLVRACVDAGVDIRVVPGPSAALSALVLSGLPTDRFVFEGFLPRRAGERRRRLEELATEARTIVVFESPRRVNAMLRDAAEALGDRRVAVARELTKLHEEVIRGRISEVVPRLADLKGEVVVVLEGRGEVPVPDLDALVTEARGLVREGLRKREAAAEVARRHGASANEIYRALVTSR
jgi:16S rRNA (cytidine1402-2'-O)-methyltransferase